jgi:hypothetical protein
MNRAMQRVYQSHKNIHGTKHIDRLIDQACEEAAELIVSLSHIQRGRANAERVLEEFADAKICIEFLARAWNVDTLFLPIWQRMPT